VAVGNHKSPESKEPVAEEIVLKKAP
jgi:hypothetical protein